MKEITTQDQLDKCIDESKSMPVFLFKHSTACPTSASANGRVREAIAAAPQDYPEFQMIKVIESRPVSNTVAERLGVQHASPQLILVQGGKAVWTASHYQITPSAIAAAVDRHVPAPPAP